MLPLGFAFCRADVCWAHARAVAHMVHAGAPFDGGPPPRLPWWGGSLQDARTKTQPCMPNAQAKRSPKCKTLGNRQPCVWNALKKIALQHGCAKVIGTVHCCASPCCPWHVSQRWHDPQLRNMPYGKRGGQAGRTWLGPALSHRLGYKVLPAKRGQLSWSHRGRQPKPLRGKPGGVLKSAHSIPGTQSRALSHRHHELRWWSNPSKGDLWPLTDIFAAGSTCLRQYLTDSPGHRPGLCSFSAFGCMSTTKSRSGDASAHRGRHC